MLDTVVVYVDSDNDNGLCNLLSNLPDHFGYYGLFYYNVLKITASVCWCILSNESVTVHELPF